MCETVSWLKARRIVNETNKQTLVSHSNDILECFGGIEQCLAILLENRYHINTIQAIKLSDMLTEINNKKTNDQINIITDEIMEKLDIQIVTTTFYDIGVECIQHITTFLTTKNIAKSFNNVCASFAIIGVTESRKADYFFMNGHDLIIENKNKKSLNKYTNKIGFGNLSALKQYRIFKDETLGLLLRKLAIEFNIPLQHLSLCILNYCDYNDVDVYPNRLHEITLNWNEEKQGEMEVITQEMILTHTMATRPYLDFKSIDSIHTRIGNISQRARRFVLLDKRKIPTISDAATGIGLDHQSDRDRMLIGIKYFDVFSQRLYFVDWVYVILRITRIVDIAHYIENNLMSNDRHYFQKCKKYLKKIRQFKSNIMVDNFIFYDEEAKQEVYETTYDALFDYNLYVYGDILVFQLNANHTYFKNHAIRVETDLSQLQATVYQRADTFMQSLPYNVNDCLHNYDELR